MPVWGAERAHLVPAILTVSTALEAAGVEFIPQNGSGPGMRSGRPVWQSA